MWSYRIDSNGLAVGPVTSFREYCYQLLDSIKSEAVSNQTERLTISQDALCYMELIMNTFATFCLGYGDG
jgi:transposase